MEITYHRAAALDAAIIHSTKIGGDREKLDEMISGLLTDLIHLRIHERLNNPTGEKIDLRFWQQEMESFFREAISHAEAEMISGGTFGRGPKS